MATMIVHNMAPKTTGAKREGIRIICPPVVMADSMGVLAVTPRSQNVNRSGDPANHVLAKFRCWPNRVTRITNAGSHRNPLPLVLEWECMSVTLPHMRISFA
jgi:hypothetical protein